MITTANRIYVHPDFAAQFEETFRTRARLVDQMPGFVSNQLPASLRQYSHREHVPHWLLAAGRADALLPKQYRQEW